LASAQLSGAGAGSSLGGGAPGRTDDADGWDATVPGAGGGGACRGSGGVQDGGDGGAGQIIIDY